MLENGLESCADFTFMGEWKKSWIIQSVYELKGDMRGI